MQPSTRTRYNLNESTENSNKVNENSSNITERFQSLVEKNNRLQQDKNKKEALLEQVKYQLEECIRKAKEEFGVGSIEELEALIKTTEEQENIKLEKLADDLNILAQTLREVDDNMRSENVL
jgi:uncharacterized protein YoxC